MSDSRNTLIGKTVLEKYQILDEVGRGGMGLVYLARDIRLGRDVALKELVLSKTLAGKDRDDIISRFNREARTTSALNHPNIVTVFDVGRDGKTHFIAMEFLPGKTLKDFLDDQYPFTYETLLDILTQIASGLSHAHAKGVIHRDIKPENITIMAENNVKIMDFGIAAIENSTSNLTQDGSILGTIAYISPEQLYNSKGVDNRADIFSYGSMMYELLSGQLPFEGDSVGETITKIMTLEPKPLQQINPKLPEKLAAITLRCIQKSADKRYQHMYEVLNELLDFKSSLSFLELQEVVRADQIGRPNKKRITRNTPSAVLLNSAVRQQRFKIMYLGADVAMQRLIQSHIKLKGLPYELQCSESLAEAQKSLSTSKSVDLVIIEFQPTQDTQAFAYFEYFAETPLVFFTELANPQMIVDIMKRGAIDYVIKSNPVEDTLKILDGIKAYLNQLKLLLNDLPVLEAASAAPQMAELSGPQPEAVAAPGTEPLAVVPAPKPTPELKPESAGSSGSYPLEFEHTFGSLGAQDSQFSSPRFIYYCEFFQELWVADTKNSRIQIFDPQGHFLRSLQHPEMPAPCALARLSDGTAYVLDALSAKALVFQGAELQAIFGGKGEALHEFQSVYGLTAYQDQAILISDPESHVVKVFDLKGQLQHLIVQGFKNHSAYKKPAALATQGDKLYLLDQGLFSVHTLNGQLEHLSDFGRRGTGVGQFGVPKGLAVDVQGRIYVSEALPHRFQVFDAEGNCLCSLGKKGAAPGEFNTVDSIAVASQGKVYVLDKENHRVQIFRST